MNGFRCSINNIAHRQTIVQSMIISFGSVMIITLINTWKTIGNDIGNRVRLLNSTVSLIMMTVNNLSC